MIHLLGAYQTFHEEHKTQNETTLQLGRERLVALARVCPPPTLPPPSPC